MRQGDTIAPTLFVMFLNDLAVNISDLHAGIPVGDETVDILQFADDILIFANSADGLQWQIQILEQWCNRWRMSVNVDKTKVLIFLKRLHPELTGSSP